jgi:hypothetical protein|tara:strand:+ start:1338 stop:1532 length:195 start_codon:yes stop_codon:yes gene_type:complete
LKKIVINNITKPCSANTLKSEVNLKSLSCYELGSSVPPADALKAIADALGGIQMQKKISQQQLS